MTWPAYRYSLFVFVLALGKTVIIIVYPQQTVNLPGGARR